LPRTLSQCQSGKNKRPWFRWHPDGQGQGKTLLWRCSKGTKPLTAAFLPAAEGEKRTAITHDVKYDFLSQTTQIIRSGWKDVDGVLNKSVLLPDLAIEDQRPVKATEEKAHVTEPPKPYTDASLLYVMEHAGKLVDDEQLAAAMKKYGLGTPSKGISF
jgi:DNA topoisomerase IA